MTTFKPRLLEAQTATTRLDALCEFIEFWLGPRQPSFGESDAALSKHPLPEPLKRLYQFAGCWPSKRIPWEWCVPAFSHQDRLLRLEKIRAESDSKIVFAQENQGVWECRTLAGGDDPPVWSYGDNMNENEQWFTGEKLVSDSLSRFLTTFVMQEISLESQVCLAEVEELGVQFESERNLAVPIWIEAPYVWGEDHNYFLWGDVLVAFQCCQPYFAANRPEGIEFLSHYHPRNEQ